MTQTLTATMTSTARAGASRRHVPPRAPNGSRSHSAADLVRVFDAEPDLLADVDDRAAAFLRQRVVTPRLWVDEGAWSPPAAGELPGSTFALLVLEGLMFRTIELDGRCGPELLGAGDLLRPWDEFDGSIAYDTSWKAIQPAAVAVLDERFAAAACRWPSIMVELLSRTLRRSRSLAVQLAIAHVRHAELRLHILLWHLADRWGRVTPEGVHLPLRLSHEMLAQLACIRRPTASSALAQLTRSGELLRRSDATWLLTGSPPSPGPAREAEEGLPD